METQRPYESTARILQIPIRGVGRTDADGTSAAEGLQNLGFDGVLSSLSFAAERKGAAVGICGHWQHSAGGYGLPHQCAHWLAMTQSKGCGVRRKAGGRADVGIGPYGIFCRGRCRRWPEPDLRKLSCHP